MHDDWSGAVRDMIQTEDGRVIFTAMKMRHDPGRHSVLTYSSTDDGKTWTEPVVIARQKGKWLAHPYAFEHKPGEVWLTTMQGAVRIRLREQDFAAESNG